MPLRSIRSRSIGIIVSDIRGRENLSGRIGRRRERGPKRDRALQTPTKKARARRAFLESRNSVPRLRVVLLAVNALALLVLRLLNAPLLVRSHVSVCARARFR